MAEFTHRSVLLNDAVEYLINDKNGIYIDGTFGRGGHSSLILSQLAENASLFAFDKDPVAIKHAHEHLSADARFEIFHQSFAQMKEVVISKGLLGKVDGVLLDLGVSSPQLDDAERGFSFMKPGPLDMRMDPTRGQSAADWLATASDEEIADVLYQYGDERMSRKIAKAIVMDRQTEPYTRTDKLAGMIERVIGNKEKKHPATRTFQAIRIHVNNELGDLHAVLADSLEILKPGGQLVVISFHSLEDRIVKQFIRKQVKGEELPYGLPIQESEVVRSMKSQNKALKPNAEEITANPRARSAVMRIAQKL